MTTEIAVQARPAGVLAVTNDAQEFTAAQLEAFGIAKASRGEQLVFLHTVQRTGLDPAAKQIYMVGRKQREMNDRGEWVEVVKHTIQTGIDGYRLIADRTGLYAGSEETWEERGGNVYSATVTVWKFVAAAGGLRPFAATAHWSEYVQTTGRGDNQRPNSMWSRMPHRMLAKCAEALALRKAFPQDLSGVYTAEEMGQADAAAERAHPAATEPAQVVHTPAQAPREDVVDAEVVHDHRPSGSVVDTTAIAAEVARRAAQCGDADELVRTFAEAKDRGLLDVDVLDAVPVEVRTVVGAQDATRLALGAWLMACGKHARGTTSSVAAAVVPEPGPDDPWAVDPDTTSTASTTSDTTETPATDGTDTLPLEG